MKKLFGLLDPILVHFRISRLSPRAVGYFITGFMVLVYLINFLGIGTLIDTIERKTYDLRLVAEQRALPKPAITIAAIDEKSVTEIGRWPWRRQVLAQLVDTLHQAGARVVVFDIFLPEPQDRAARDLVRAVQSELPAAANSPSFRKLRQSLDADRELAAAITRSGNVVLSMAFLATPQSALHLNEADKKKTFELIAPHAFGAIRYQDNPDFNFPLRATVYGVDANVPEIQRAGLRTGHINAFPDVDGTIRRGVLVMRYQDRFFPSGDLQAVRTYLGVQNLVLHTAEYGIRGVQLGNRLIPTDEDGRVLIHYYGPSHTFPTIPVSDILNGKADPAQLRDRIVLIGATALGIGDIKVTPFGTTFPGPEIRANAMQNMIDGSFILRPNMIAVLEVLILLVLGLGLSYVMPRAGVRNSAIAVIVLSALYIALGMYLFRVEQTWLNLTYPVLLMVLLFMSNTFIYYFRSESEKLQIKGAFQHYVSATVVDQIIDNIHDLKLGGEKREMTVLFSDIRGFTTMSEAMAPEDLVKLLNNYLTRMTERVFENKGTLDKYIGDAIMAFYGAPLQLPNHAALACRTAQEMMQALMELQAQWRLGGLPVLNIGVGINSGPMIVGNMGSEERFDYTVIGDAVNLGSRIEHMNKEYGTNILISEFTYDQVKDEFSNLRRIDVAPVRGRREPVGIYEMMLPQRYKDFDWVADFNRAYELFHADKVKDAQKLFEALAEEVDDPVSRFYVGRCTAPRRRRSD
jgi:adenylate cyclase